MPFKPIDFSNIEPQGNPFFRDLVENLSTGYKAGQLPQQLERQRQQEELANALQKYKVQEEPEKFKSEQLSREIERAFQQAQTGKINTMTPLEARELALKNELYPKLTESQITNNLALAKQRQLGYGVMNAGGKEELFYQHATQEANPDFTPEQLSDAINQSRQGQTTLSDGKTPINITQMMSDSADRMGKYGTTGSLLTQMKTGEQAGKEIDVLSKYIIKGIGKYGNTVFGHSPDAILASFSNKEEDQKALGRVLAAMQLNVELASVQERLATNKSTATITEEIIRHANDEMKTDWPFISQTARVEKNRYMREALHEGFAERSKIKLGIGKVNPTSGSSTTTKATQRYNRETGDFEAIK